MTNPWAVYDLLLDKVNNDILVEEFILGLTWTYCRSSAAAGLAMSPGQATRTLSWPGTMQGRQASQVASWIKSWQPHQATAAMACINSVLSENNSLSDRAVTISESGPANLQVFEHFLPRLQNKRTVVIGRYPGLERYQSLDLQVIERNSSDMDYPDPACEYLIPEADWVFLTASSIVNKTFPRLAELASNANLVLCGPTTPWLDELSEFGVDFLAGVRITDDTALRQTVMQGGGTRIFETGLEYAVVDLGHNAMLETKASISELYTERDSLKQHMQQWYESGESNRFPGYTRLAHIDTCLSQLDLKYKRMWDARNPAQQKKSQAIPVADSSTC